MNTGAQPGRPREHTGLLCLLVLMCTWGCQSAADRTPVPAVLSNTSTEITAELQEAASQLLEGRPVTLGQSAFTRHNSLTLEPAMRNTPLGRLASGRTIDQPDALRLLLRGKQCVLEHINSGRQVVLETTDCTADPAANPKANKE